MTNPINTYTVPSVSITTARTGASAKANELGMRVMQERAYAKRGEQYLLIKSPPASGKSRALMFIALDKLHNQGIQQAIVVVPERSIGGSFADEALTQHGFYWDWTVAPQWNLCNAPGIDEPRVAKSKVEAVKKYLSEIPRSCAPVADRRSLSPRRKRGVHDGNGRRHGGARAGRSAGRRTRAVAAARAH